MTTNILKEYWFKYLKNKTICKIDGMKTELRFFRNFVIEIFRQPRRSRLQLAVYENKNKFVKQQ